MAAPPAPRPPPAHSPDTQFRMSATQSAAPRGRHRHQKHAPRLHMPRRTPPASCYQRLRSSQLQPFLRCCASPDMGLYRLPLASTPHCPPDLRHAAPRHRSRPRRRDVTWLGDILPGDIYLVSPGRLAGRRPPPTPKRVSRGGRTAQPSSNTLASPTASTVPCTVTLSYYYYITVLADRGEVWACESASTRGRLSALTEAAAAGTGAAVAAGKPLLTTRPVPPRGASTPDASPREQLVGTPVAH